MSIQEHLNKIRNAVYGKEVRESIAKGIETAYDDASEKDNANMEVKIARGTNPNLNTRLNKMDETDRQNTEKIDSNYNEVTAQLAQAESSKVDKSGSGQVKWANIAQDAREQISGDKVAVVDDNSIITTNLTNNSVKTSKIGKQEVTPATTSFIKKSTNLLNKDNVVEDKIISVDGSIVDNATYVYSHRIDVLPGQTLFTRQVTSLAFYDQNDSFISRPDIQDVSKNFSVVPENCYYVRGNMTKHNYDFSSVQVSISDVEIPYEPFHEELDNIRVNANNIIGQFGSSALENKSVTVDKTDFIETSKNLVDKKKTVDGFTISGSSGELGANPKYYVTEPIPVKPNINIISNATRYALYDTEGKFISSALANSFKTAFNTGEIRLAFEKEVANPQANVGEVLLPYEEYHKPRLSEEIEIPNLPQNPEADHLTLDRYVVNGTLDGWYHGKTIPKDSFTIDSQPEAVYALYDKLVNDFPDYVSRQQIETSIQGRPIYRYNFTLPHVDGDDTKVPTMMLVAGTHGNERMSGYTLYFAMEAIAKGWKESELLGTLRWNVNFVVIPLVNPDAWHIWQRKNANEIDINRQFPVGWSSGTPSSSTYGGTAPMTEPEAIAVKETIDSLENVIYFCDFHNFTAVTEGENVNRLFWNAYGTKFNGNLAKSFLTTMSKEWKKNHVFFPQDYTTIFGHTSSTPAGSMALYVASLGIQASTFEVNSGIHYYKPDDEPYGGMAMTLYTEAFINWLILNLRNNVQLYNELES